MDDIIPPERVDAARSRKVNEMLYSLTTPELVALHDQIPVILHGRMKGIEDFAAEANRVLALAKSVTSKFKP